MKEQLESEITLLCDDMIIASEKVLAMRHALLERKDMLDGLSFSELTEFFGVVALLRKQISLIKF